MRLQRPGYFVARHDALVGCRILEQGGGESAETVLKVVAGGDRKNRDGGHVLCDGIATSPEKKTVPLAQVIIQEAACQKIQRTTAVGHARRVKVGKKI